MQSWVCHYLGLKEWILPLRSLERPEIWETIIVFIIAFYFLNGHSVLGEISLWGILSFQSRNQKSASLVARLLVFDIPIPVGDIGLEVGGRIKLFWVGFNFAHRPSLDLGDGASLIAQLVNYLLAVQETRVRFLGQEDPLEKEMATHSSILAWRIPWPEEPFRLQSMGSQELDTT